MHFGVLGTGGVGQALAGKLASLGHEVKIGTRDVATTLAKTEPDNMGNPPIGIWLNNHPEVMIGTFAEVAAFGEMLVNATVGVGSIPALQAAGEENINGKVLIDISNPLDFSKGFPPSLYVCNTDSLGEQIQRAFPSLKVVKTLNTMTNAIMVNPQTVAGGDHQVFLSGDDIAAKAEVNQILQSFGWLPENILDLGGISSARAVEMWLPLWVNIYAVTQNGMFNLKLVR
jgi:8-hydroxy-5-deazaflavin:NADPH oxidoreductase